MPNGGEIRIETSDGMAPSAALGLGGRAERCALLRVSDTGGGIDLEIRDHVFEPFFTTKEVGKGTGLGLATVYGIVQQHHGFIELQSEPGVGTTFSIFLPPYEGPEAPDILTTPVADASSERGCETLLLAEDEDAIRNLAEVVLTRQGYRVLSAADGESAVKLFEAHADEIALAVLDVVMPKKNGRDVYLRLQEMKPGTAVLFCSGYPAIDHRLMLDMDEEILHKPYTISDLIRAVRRKLNEVRDAGAKESTTT
jgi:CheY-like chemotaxis protein